jgi:hypothetical protein
MYRRLPEEPICAVDSLSDGLERTKLEACRATPTAGLRASNVALVTIVASELIDTDTDTPASREAVVDECGKPASQGGAEGLTAATMHRRPIYLCGRKVQPCTTVGSSEEQ